MRVLSEVPGHECGLLPTCKDVSRAGMWARQSLTDTVQPQPDVLLEAFSVMSTEWWKTYLALRPALNLFTNRLVGEFIVRQDMGST